MPYQPCSVGSVAPTVDTPIVDACLQSTNSLLADVIGERPTGGEKGACRIARLIEEDLISNGWATGAACPSEQSIAKRFGTGRSSVRGAVRILEVRGVARMIPGPKGGLRVLGLDSEHTIGAVVGFARFLGTGTAELDEARDALERVRQNASDAAGIGRDIGSQTDAILKFFASVLAAMVKATEDTGSSAPRSSVLLAPDTLRRSRAGQIAGQMLGDFTVEQWVRGHRLGSEEDLCFRYGADRDAFRQAVRILESVGAAETLCGRGHGLVSKAPRAGSIARLVSCLFASSSVHPTTVMSLFEHLSVEIVGLSAARAVASDCALVRQSLDDIEAALDRQDADSILGCVYDVEETILGVCGNPLLRLFVQSLRGYPSARIPRDVLALTAMNRQFLRSSRTILATYEANDTTAAMAAQRARIAVIAEISRTLQTTDGHA